MTSTAKKSKKGGRTTEKKGKGPVDLKAFLDLKERPKIEYPVIADTELADAFALAEQALDDAKKRADRYERVAAATENRDAVVPADLLEEIEELRAAHAEAKAAADAVTMTFVFQALPRPRLIHLYGQYGPTEKQKSDFKAELKSLGKPTSIPAPFNEDTFPPVLIFEAMKFPEMTEAQVNEMWFGPECEDCDGEGCDDEPCVDGRRPDLGNWSKAELDGMFLAAEGINKIVR